MLYNMAQTIRHLSFEMVERAQSGHPGLPMGCAELGAYLYGYQMRHNPANPHWEGRDRLILSAGHGSAWLYACLHLAGYDLHGEDLKAFRQWHSKTPGHPEYGETAGVEATTGPLGQGVGNAVGQALGLKILAQHCQGEGAPYQENKVFCLAGDGCLMEGVSAEVSSLAGHLVLDNFILLHDANQITLDGPLGQSSSEDLEKRYAAYGFDTFHVDGHDLYALDALFREILPQQKRPLYIACHTTIGKGAPHKEGTHQVHGAPLGPEEIKATKAALNLPDESFSIPDDVQDYLQARKGEHQRREEAWQAEYAQWQSHYPERANRLTAMQEKRIPPSLEEALAGLPLTAKQSGRKASQQVLQLLGRQIPALYGGSADLSGSDCTMMEAFSLIAPQDFGGRNIKYGVREFGMATIAAGLWQTGSFIPYVGTFFTFSDYMRNAIRLASLSGYQVIYQFTHDSILVGEDGPTHQPVEHLASLRAMPNLPLFRPADAHEVRASWIAMLGHEGPSAIVLSRQDLPLLAETDRPCDEGVGRGAYILRQEKGGNPHFTLFATGSEVSLALEVADQLLLRNRRVRVVSVPCWERFALQDEDYQESIVGGDLGRRISIEAASSLGWERFIGREGLAISVETFGASAPAEQIKENYGFTVDSILERLLA
ncbi:MAG: transketolase [Chlamydiota bacterium]|nr:transketolase [Chlamydiota bacterium]